jgi:magnesium transporter
MESRLAADTLKEPVTKHMRLDFTRLRAGQTVGDALAMLRAQPPEGRIIYFYVVDEEDRLAGVVPTRRLLLSPPERPVAEVMLRQVITVPDAATVLEACEFFVLHRLLAFPVVDRDRRVVGVVDVELYTDELGAIETKAGHDDLFQLIGVQLTEAQQGDPVLSFRRRLPWLLCNIAGGIVAAFLSGVFEEDLRRTVALALFIPVVLALSESVAIQSVSLALQAMHGRRPTWGTMFARARQEAVVGLLLGGATSLIVGTVALVWLRQFRLSVCLLGGITGGVAGAALFGLTIPVALRLLRRDPQVAAGPVALAAADLLTLLLYFGLARALLGA